MIRPQAILVLIVVLIVVLSGASTVAYNAVTERDRSARQVGPVAVTPDVIATATGVPVIAPSPTPTPDLTAKPTLVPTETPVPRPTERPAPPRLANTAAGISIDQGTSGRREVALTFDAGAGRGYTEQILDLLAQEGVTATFGVTGKWAEEHPDLMRRIVADGHMVINHTYDHVSFTGDSTRAGPLTPSQREAQLARTEQVIANLTGYQTAPYFRFPYGDYDAEALEDIAAAGYPYAIRWSCDSLAWRGSSAGQIVQKCGEKAEPGAIILLHVDPIADYEALPGLIDTLRARDFQLVTVEQLLQP
ncbi:MAG: polysaccharide deacetylase family protein [Chloroflexota bacterium]|nr:polysaccharide deacetylase family protein [Chloroflexota bacterium]